MVVPPRSKTVRFWKIYGLVIAVDLLLYLLIFYVGKAIPSPPDQSAPGNAGLMVAWALAHMPGTLIFTKQLLSESFAWLLILQDAWLAGLIYFWRRKRVITMSEPALH